MRNLEGVLPHSLGHRLRTARKRAGLTGADVATALGILTQQVFNIETRGDDIRASQLFVLADLLNVDARWLVTGVHAAAPTPPFSSSVLNIASTISNLPQKHQDALALLFDMDLP